MNYTKPIIEEEVIEIADVIAASSTNGGSGTVNDSNQGVGVGNIF